MMESYLDGGVAIDFVWKIYFPKLYFDLFTLTVSAFAFYSARFCNVDVTVGP